MSRRRSRRELESQDASPEKAVMVLLDEVCARLGFILSGPARTNLLASLPTTDVDTFTDAVLVADGLDPAIMDTSLRHQARDMVQERIGHLLGTDR